MAQGIKEEMNTLAKETREVRNCDIFFDQFFRERKDRIESLQVLLGIATEKGNVLEMEKFVQALLDEYEKLGRNAAITGAINIWRKSRVRMKDKMFFLEKVLKKKYRHFHMLMLDSIIISWRQPNINVIEEEMIYLFLRDEWEYIGDLIDPLLRAFIDENFPKDRLRSVVKLVIKEKDTPLGRLIIMRWSALENYENLQRILSRGFDGEEQGILLGEVDEEE